MLRTVQAEGIRGLTAAQRRIYTPPAGGGFVTGFARRTSVDINFSNQSIPFGPTSYLSAQSRVVEEYTMSQIVLQALRDGGSIGMLIVVTGASHVVHGSRGVGLPARISKKLPKKNQVVILLNPERQEIRKEGVVPTADFLWYSAARPCSRNCFDRAEIARVMNAASRRRDALPQVISTYFLSYFLMDVYNYISIVTLVVSVTVIFVLAIVNVNFLLFPAFLSSRCIVMQPRFFRFYIFVYKSKCYLWMLLLC